MNATANVAIKSPSSSQDMIVLPIFDAFVIKRRLNTIMNEKSIRRVYFLLSECHNNLIQPKVHTNITYTEKSYIIYCIKGIAHEIRKATQMSMMMAKMQCEALYNYVENICSRFPYNGIGESDGDGDDAIFMIEL